jgi:hypothetical protein
MDSSGTLESQEDTSAKDDLMVSSVIEDHSDTVARAALSEV